MAYLILPSSLAGAGSFEWVFTGLAYIDGGGFSRVNRPSLQPASTHSSTRINRYRIITSCYHYQAKREDCQALFLAPTASTCYTVEDGW